jgi:tetratricopeptide (TPR) repeat protein
LKRRSAVWNKLAVALAVLAIAAGGFYSARRDVIESSNPAALRAKNWVSAAAMFIDNPMGTGLNNYGVMYSKYMLADANETQNAHNTALQLLSELGISFALAGAVFAFILLRDRNRQRRDPASMYVLLALIVWVVHNMIDIDVYFPSVGVAGVVLAAVYFRRSGAHYPQSLPRAAKAASVVLGLLFIVFSSLVMVSTELQREAEAQFDEKKWTDAARTLEQATTIMPINASLFHDYGEVLLNLYHSRHDPSLLAAATTSFEKAIAWSPYKAGHYTGLSLSLGSANRVDEALEQIEIAQRLAPTSSQVDSIKKLLQTRRSGDPRKRAASR